MPDNGRKESRIKCGGMDIQERRKKNKERKERGRAGDDIALEYKEKSNTKKKYRKKYRKKIQKK